LLPDIKLSEGEAVLCVTFSAQVNDV